MSTGDSCTIEKNVPATDTLEWSERENMTIGFPHQSVGTCFGLPYQDHNYGAPPPPTPPSFSPQLSPLHISPVVENETVSIVTTTLYNEEANETSITRCVCGFEHDDEYMICCDKCLVWQHVDCMGLDRSKIPETYLCEQCEPRLVDRQKAKLLQAKKKVVLPDKLIFTETSEDSEEDIINQNSETSKTKGLKNSVKKKPDDEDLKADLPALRKGKGSLNKNSKEGLEMKQSKLRRKAKNHSDSTCATDEEAQDAWKCFVEWPKGKLESSTDNQYSEEIYNLASNLKTQSDEQKCGKLLCADLCKVVDFPDQKKLVAINDLARDQVIIEFKGQFTSASLFREKHPVFKHRLFPYVLFYKLRSNEELCVDATNYKCDAKYVRRSCTPNAEVQHFVVGGSLHLYIISIRDIKKDEEITIPFDSGCNLSVADVTCACDSENCCLGFNAKVSTSDFNEKRKGSKNVHISADEDSNHSLLPFSTSLSPVKCKHSAIKSSLPSQKVNFAIASIQFDGNEPKINPEEQDTEDSFKEHKKKLTREERKLDAIMRAFDQMEKAAKRRQQVLDRMSQQKSNNTFKQDETAEKQDSPTELLTKEEEEMTVVLPAALTPENSVVDNEKPNNTQTLKPKKGKRRRSSGTSSRKRTRTNSGGSDVFTGDDASNVSESPTVTTLPSSVIETLENVTLSSSEPTTSVQQPAVSPVFPKTKRFLHHEWLQEKVESIMSTPLFLHKEVSCNVTVSPTCYVRCTKDNPSSGGISAAHLRRSSISGHGKQLSGQGSAKKRWLRQAMHDNEPWEGELVVLDGINSSVSPLHSVCCSPRSIKDAGSPAVSPPDDQVTPLKKRRLMRKSVESLLLLKSPITESNGASTWMSPDQSSCEPVSDSLVDNISSESSKGLESSSASSTANFIEKCGQTTENGLEKHLLKSLRESWIKHDNKTKSLASESNFSVPLKQRNDNVSSAFEDEVKVEKPETEVNLSNQATSANELVDEHISNEINQNHVNEDNESAHLSASINTTTVKDIESHIAGDICASNLNKTEFTDNEHSSKKIAVSRNSCADISDSSGNYFDQVQLASHDKNLPCGSCQEDCIASEQAGQPVPCKDTLEMETPALSRTEKYSKDSNVLGSINANELSQEPANTSTSLEFSEFLPSKNNCNVPELYAQTRISSNSVSRNVCSPVNILISHNNNIISSTFNNSGLCGSKKEDLSDETVPTDVQSCFEVEHPKESNVSEGAYSRNNKDFAGASATQKRKVSLSEYRRRKRDNPRLSQGRNIDGEKRSNNCVLKSADSSEASSDMEMTLASLPLFQNAKTADVEKLEKSSEEISGNTFEAQKTDGFPSQRENLTDRLKREFGLDDDLDFRIEDDFAGSKMFKKANDSPVPKISPDIAPILSLCTQLPPPPPPPSSSALPGVNSSCSTVPPQFNYRSPQAPFVIPQIPSNQQYIAAHNAVGCQPIMPILHSTLPNCSYSGSLPRPPFPSSILSQGYIGLPQHIAQMSLPPSYPTPPFHPKVYK